VTAWCDGNLLAPDTLPKAVPGRLAPFETMGAAAGLLPLWERHLGRLQATAVRLGLPFAPPPPLRAAAVDLLRQNGHDDGILKLQILPSARSVHVVMTTRSRGAPLSSVVLLPTVVPRLPPDPPGDLKCAPRRFYDAVQAQAQDGGADDGIVVGPDGAVLETSRHNLWLLLEGIWVTPPLDGAVLPGIARGLLLERAAAGGLPCAERRCDLGDLHRAQALAVSNAVYGPRPARLAGSGAPAVAIVDSSLGALWRAAATGSSR
jgi:branched-subunit amino acid aminotransferase/4-amino-4-deoxychorismate lyase